MDTSKLTFLLIYFLHCSSADIAVQLERFEQIGGEHLLETSAMRVRKYNRTTFTANGTFLLLQDIDETYEATLKTAYSRLGNNQFNEYPMKIPQKTLCQVIVDEYQQYQYVFQGRSNLPILPSGTQRFCPFPKGEYWIRDLLPDASWVPPVVPAGYWRFTVECWRKEELQASWRIFLRITKGFI
ncbi:hypothetical protein pipiens_013004 [Culex pipiens pipiens]|uniref:Uncharacterized protein n=1 Tax=Culex pipiens pipiens TaxID=38569 RepID=A0ABD1D034_CULPP